MHPATRHPPTLHRRVRLAFWRRRRLARKLRCIGYRLLRLPDAPRNLALGVAIGVFIATLPIPGVQMAVAAVAAWMVGGNVHAALIGTFWANPLTLPILWLSAHWIGQRVLGAPAVPDVAILSDRLPQLANALMAPSSEALQLAYATLWPTLKPVAVGSVLLGLICAFVFYGLTLHLIAGYRDRGRNVATVDPHGVPAIPLVDLGRPTI